MLPPAPPRKRFAPCGALKPAPLAQLWHEPDHLLVVRHNGIRIRRAPSPQAPEVFNVLLLLCRRILGYDRRIPVTFDQKPHHTSTGPLPNHKVAQRDSKGMPQRRSESNLRSHDRLRYRHPRQRPRIFIKKLRLSARSLHGDIARIFIKADCRECTNAVRGHVCTCGGRILSTASFFGVR